MNYRRARQAGGCFFFTVVTHHRQPLLVEHIDRLRQAFRRVIHRHPFRIDAIVVMPDHLHAMWTLPESDTDYSTRWALIKRGFSIGLPARADSVSRISKREKGIWQRRFWEHRIRDQADWERHLDYIHFNPVKHGLVPSAGDWPYSSFHRLVARGWYPEDWGREEPARIAGLDFE
ncbi:REP-associated tyrosine transposase [Thiohalobacter sp.]|uniref:REP-associated tyrosine transposase n=1 Tax=Thiohalobacter sp. TaxID=2025948 RepID=UPI0026134C94|nr:transposase [Thiohalobacter sp.]